MCFVVLRGHRPVAPDVLNAAPAGQVGPLTDAISQLAACVSRHVLDLIMGKHQLMMHLRAIKKFLLLGQGDFVQALMDLTWYSWQQAPSAAMGCALLTGAMGSSVVGGSPPQQGRAVEDRRAL